MITEFGQTIGMLHGIVPKTATVEDVRSIIRLTQHVKDQLDINIRKIASEFDPTVQFGHWIGYWECPRSPFGVCAYNAWEDRGKDDCIYCHEPDERK